MDEKCQNIFGRSVRVENGLWLLSSELCQKVFDLQERGLCANSCSTLVGLRRNQRPYIVEEWFALPRLHCVSFPDGVEAGFCTGRLLIVISPAVSV